MSDKIHILVCENYINEVLAIIAAGGEFEGVTASSFPSRCGLPPLSSKEIPCLLSGEESIILGNACLTLLNDAHDENVHDHIQISTPCFNMLMEHSTIEKMMLEGAYLLTPGWLAHWQERIVPWKFTRDGLCDFLHETMKTLVLLDTGIDNDSPDHLREFADYAAMSYDIIPVGLDFFSQFLKVIVLNRRLELQKAKADETAKRLQQKTSDYAMALDLLARFTMVQNEKETIRLILDIFNMLLAPQDLSYVSFEYGAPLTEHFLHSQPRTPALETLQRIASLQGDHIWNEPCGGIFRVALNSETLGIVIVDRITFPEYRQHYRDLALTILLPVCALSINNARNFQQVIQTEEELQRANNELQRLATIDALTQVANRRHFDDYLAQEWRRAMREKSSIAAIMIDVDHFKEFNDTFGHQAGDICLKTIARVIAGCISRPADLVCRYGGEEFAVILPNTVAEGAIHLAEDVRTAMEAMQIRHAVSEIAPYVTLSLGVAAVVPDGSSTTDMLVQLADKALYQAKSEGRNRVVLKKQPELSRCNKPCLANI